MSMWRSRAAAIGVAVAVTFVLSAPAADAIPSGNPNHESYWESGFYEGYECTKYPGTGKYVVLDTDDYEWLVVKGGPSRNVTPNPRAGIPYRAPENRGGQIPDVSHYIVCDDTRAS